MNEHGVCGVPQGVPESDLDRNRRPGAGWTVHVVVAGVLLAGAPVTAAVEWSVTPDIKGYLEYNDNPRMLTDAEDDGWNYQVDGKARFEARTPATELKLTPRLRFRHYPYEQRLDSDDQFIDLDLSHLMRQMRWSLKGNYTRDSTLTSEVETTGNVANRFRRERWNLQPSLYYLFDLRNSLQVGLVHDDVSYEDDAHAAGFVDYRNSGAFATYARALNPRDTVSAMLFTYQYDAPAADSKTDTYGIEAAIKHLIEKDFKVEAALGLRTSDQDFVSGGIPQDSTDNGVVARAAVERKQGPTVWKASLSRSVDPTGEGFLLQRDELKGSVEHQLKPKLSGKLGVRAFQNRSLGDEISSSDRNWGQLSAGLRYRLTREWSVAGDYRYTHQKYDDDSDSSTQNSVMFTVAYQPGRKVLSQ